MHKKQGEAYRAGDTFYDTGKPCKRGHVAPRYASSGICKECQRGTNLLHAEALRGERGTKAQRLAEQRDVLNHCGPMNRQEAERVDLDWYYYPGPSCHGVVALDGVTCHKCRKEIAGAKARMVEEMLS